MKTEQEKTMVTTTLSTLNYIIVELQRPIVELQLRKFGYDVISVRTSIRRQMKFASRGLRKMFFPFFLDREKHFGGPNGRLIC